MEGNNMSSLLWNMKLGKEPMEVEPLEGFVLVITQAVLLSPDSKKVPPVAPKYAVMAAVADYEGAQKKFPLCVLREVTTENVKLDVVISNEEDLELSVETTGSGEVHLTGYYQAHEPNDEPEYGMYGEMMDDDSDSESDMEDEDSDDGELAVVGRNIVAVKGRDYDVDEDGLNDKDEEEEDDSESEEEKEQKPTQPKKKGAKQGATHAPVPPKSAAKRPQVDDAPSTQSAKKKPAPSSTPAKPKAATGNDEGATDAAASSKKKKKRNRRKSKSDTH